MAFRRLGKDWSREKDKEFQAQIEHLRKEADQARIPIPQADGSTVLVIDADKWLRLMKQLRDLEAEYQKWFVGCLEK